MMQVTVIRKALRRLDDMTDRFARDDRGSTMIEYSLIVALIFLVIVAALRAYAGSMSEMYSEIESAVSQ